MYEGERRGDTDCHVASLLAMTEREKNNWLIESH